MKLMPLSIAVRMILMLSFSSCCWPMCEPPRPTIETFSPVRPSVRRGISPACVGVGA